MANYNCSSCEELRQKDPNLLINGFSDDNCENLSKGNGLTGDGDTCEDLDLMNDCFVGNMEREVKSYEACDWKPFMRKFIPNLWTTLKAMICAICGLQCKVDFANTGYSFSIGEDESDGSYVVAGKGVSFLEYDQGQETTNIYAQYVAGGLLRVGGSLALSTSNFTDIASCWNFDDDGEEPTKSASRKGHSIWNNTETQTINGETYHPMKYMGRAGELLYEIRINLEVYPEIKKIFAGVSGPTGGGIYQTNLTVGDAGDVMYGQNIDSPTHTVPDNWIYIQMRMIDIGYLIATTDHHYSPRGYMGIRFNTDNIEC